MKLLIDSTLQYTDSWSLSTPEDDIADIIAAWKDTTDICDACGIQYMFDNPEGSIIFTIYVQKVTLDEFKMNEIFAEVLTYFEYHLEYANIGGRGCDMALCLTEKV